MKITLFSGTLLFIFLMFLPFSSSVSVWWNSQPMSFWKFDDLTQGQNITDYGYANSSLWRFFDCGPGISTCYSEQVAGIINNAFLSNQSNNETNGVRLNTASESEYDLGKTNFTIAFWFNASGTSDYANYLFSKDEQFPAESLYWLRMNVNGSLSLAIDQTGIPTLWINTEQEYRDGLYHRVVWTRNTSAFDNHTLYIDNQMVGNNNFSAVHDIQSGVNFNIGNYKDNNYFTNMSLDSFEWYNFTWSDSDIDLDYNDGRGMASDVININDVTYNNESFTGTDEEFLINFDFNSTKFKNINVSLIYNETFYQATTLNSGDTRNYTASLIIPSIDSITDLQFKWGFELENYAGNISVNSTLYNQTVSPLPSIVITSASCGSGFFEAVHFDSIEEYNLTSQNTSIEYNFNYGTFNNRTIINLAGNISNIESFSICINETANNLYSGLSEFHYGEGDFVERRFYTFDSVHLTNSTTINHSLHNLGNIDATSFLITVRDTTLIPQDNVIVSLLRWYPNLNQYRTVEMGRTNDDGQTVLKVIEEDIDYRLQVSNTTGNQIFITEPTRMICLIDPCVYNIFVEESVLSVAQNIEYSLTFDIDTFTLIWNDPDQALSLINLTVYQDTSVDSFVICSESSTFYSGVLSCNISGQSGIFRAVAYISSSPPYALTTLIAEIRQRLQDLAQGNIVLWGIMLLAMTGALIGAFISPIVALAFTVIALVPAWSLGAVTFSILTAILILFLVIAHFLRRIT